MTRGSFPSRTELTADFIRELFSYNTETGLLTCIKQRSGQRKVGSVVDRQRPDGYIECMVKGHTYLVHRLIWLLVYGKWPENELDHINGVKHDNRLINLRDATINENNGNILRAKSQNKLGVLGVSKYKNKFTATVKHNKKRYYLGVYNTQEEASQAYQTAKESFRVESSPLA